TYVFDETKFNMGTTTYENLENDFHLSFLAEDGIWHCVGMSYVGADAVINQILEDAPEDGKQYARQDAGWSEISVDVQEAPADGKQYARQNSGWTEVDTGTIGAGEILQVVSTTSGTAYTGTAATNISVAITPKIATSKLIVMADVNIGTANNTNGFVKLTDNGSQIWNSRSGGNYGGSANACTTQVRNSVSTATRTFQVHSSGVQINTGPYGAHSPSSVTVMEVSF
ncbi:MAG: hypothetical protein VW683_16975, partial [Betaproteobacteria bacterium]